MKKNLILCILISFLCGVFFEVNGRSFSRNNRGCCECKTCKYKRDNRGYGRAYGAYGRHYACKSHPGYDEYGSVGYIRGSQDWGYYNSYDRRGYYPWEFYGGGDPYHNFQKADYYPWYYGYNPMYLWW